MNHDFAQLYFVFRYWMHLCELCLEYMWSKYTEKNQVNEKIKEKLIIMEGSQKKIQKSSFIF